MQKHERPGHRPGQIGTGSLAAYGLSTTESLIDQVIAPSTAGQAVIV